ncbi:MAG: restriction endonuclease subunit S [Calditrichaeota bacterium]|nr:restriction endonuclease subunit S [Calditrichota bacterium]
MKTNVPEIRFQGFEEEWETLEYKDLFSKLSNNSLSRDELNYSSGSAKNVHYGDVLIKFSEILDIKTEILPYINDSEIVMKYITSKLRDGDIVMADAAEDETVGKCTELVNVKNETILAGLHTIAIRPEIDFASLYLGYYLNSDQYHSQLLRLMQGTKVSSISNTALRDTIISFPSDKSEQTKIGSYFKNLDRLITLKQRKLDKLKNVKKSMLEKMFPREGAAVPEIRFQGFSGEWERKTLGEVTLKIGDGLHGTPTYHDNGEFYFINGNNLIDGKISVFKDTRRVNEDALFSDDKELNENTILLSINGTIGNLALYLGEKVMLGKSVAYLMLNKVYKLYMFYVLQNSCIKQYFFSNLTGSTIKNLGLETIRKTCLLIPIQIEEQTKIGNYFKNLDRLISLQQKEIEKLKQIKSSCLSKMFV